MGANLAGRGGKYRKHPGLRAAEIDCTLMFNSHFSKRTIKWHRHSNKLFGRGAQRQALPSTTNKTRHLEFIKRHWDYDCKRAQWPDENKIESFAQTQPRHIWQQKRKIYKGMHLIVNMEMDACFGDDLLPVIQGRYLRLMAKFIKKYTRRIWLKIWLSLLGSHW